MTQPFNFWNYLFSSRTHAWHIPILLFLSILLFCVSGIIDIPGVLNSPQFTTPLEPAFVKELLHANHWHFEGYKAYFIIDCVWAPVLLLAIVKFARAYVLRLRVVRHARGKLIALGFLAIAAYAFDLAENYIYFFHYTYHQTIVYLKIGFYSIVVLIWLILIIHKYKNDVLPTLKDFLKSAWISLIILVIIGSLLPKAPQVNSIVVNLYDYPLNFVVLLLFAPIYAVMLAHYPSYFNITEEHRSWYRAENFKFWLFGTIFYKYKDGYQDSGTGRTESIVNFLFRIIGVLFFAALFYLIAYTSEVNFNWPLSMNEIAVSLTLFGVYLLFILRKKKNDWLNNNILYLVKGLPNFYDGDITLTNANKTKLKEFYALSDKKREEYNITKHNSLYKINFHIYCYLILFIVTVVLFFWLVISLYLFKYNMFNAILSLVSIVFQLVTFIYYRTFRSIFRFSFYNPNIKAVLNSFYVLRVFKVVKNPMTELVIAEREKKIKNFLISHTEFYAPSFFNPFKKLGFGALSNNIFFLQFTATVGIINAVIFLILNIFSIVTVQQNINSILVILSAFFLYYGIIIIITKNIIYYRFSQELYAEKRRNLYYKFLAYSCVCLVLMYGLTRSFSNNLFTLQHISTAQVKDSTLFLKDYATALKEQSGPRYFVGAYGGGMKANAWTLTILNEMHQRDSSFFDHTVVMSGASGGTIGIINMAAILHQKNSIQEYWTDKIHEISTENILSLDLTHVLGRDTFNRMFIPGLNLYGKDRSSKAMHRYAAIVHCDPNKYMNKSFYDYWFEIYKQQNKRFPILIANTTNVKGNHGMAVSVKVDSDQEQHSFLFQGADNILTLGNNSLSYYDAASTSNRFPVISPAAKIETKGHYNDGGIFENSGLLSALKTFRAINALDGTKDLDSLEQTNTFINIVNDKNLYIRHYLKQNLKDTITVNKINGSSEIDAILNSVSSTEMMPNFVKNEVQRLADRHMNIEFHSIYLPHQFTVQDVFNIYGKKIQLSLKNDKETLKSLYDIVEKNNDTIQSLVKTNDPRNRIPIVEPPMSRVLAKDAYIFMKKMLDHSIPSNTMDSIFKKE